MQPGMELNPFEQPPHLHQPTREYKQALGDELVYDSYCFISDHGNGGLVRDQGSSDAPLTPLPKKQTVASCRCSPLFCLEESKRV